MSRKIAILGSGNMGGAIAASLAGPADYEVTCTAASRSTLDRLLDTVPGVSVSLSNAEAVAEADIVVIAVKPYIAPQVISEIKPCLRPGTTVITVVATHSLESLSEELDAGKLSLNIFRVIPNTAIRNGKSVTFIARDKNASRGATDEVKAIFDRSGHAFIVPEKDMNACMALASCGIAYFLRFIRAAAEGSVELGLRPAFATTIAALTAEGAASLLADGAHPEAEIDKVTTPGGITIRGLNALEANGFTNAVIEALRASVVKQS